MIRSSQRYDIIQVLRVVDDSKQTAVYHQPPSASGYYQVTGGCLLIQTNRKEKENEYRTEFDQSKS